MTNPLLAEWQTTFSLPPFADIQDKDFAPAFETAMARGRAAYRAIAADPNPPDFTNTIEAMELADRTLEQVAGVFFNLAGSDSNPAREALQRDLSPKLAAYAAEITADKALFSRIELLWEQRAEQQLTSEQTRVLELYRRMFQRAGVALQGAEADRMTAIKSRLASLGTEFAQNVLAEERNWMLPLDGDSVAALPDFLRAATADAARERGQDGHLITLNRSLIVPFLEHAPDRDLRRDAYVAWTTRGANGDAYDNRALVAEILALRAERAALLGYESFAAFKLETEMARTAEAVRALLMQVWPPARAQAEADATILERMLRADGHDGPLEPWDWRYYATRRRREEHDLDDAQIKPYLSLENMIAAAFDCANRLFGLEFHPLELPLYHRDARAWEVTRNGQHMAVFIGDYLARPAKRSGAWCSAFRTQRRLGGAKRAVVVNQCNFARGAPALLSWDDARTLFHEFGHALHHILSDVTYAFVSGTSVARDFVELPSQLFEHWLEVPELLRSHARHVATGAPMPKDLLERLIAAQNFDQGFATVEYLASALVDLAYHDGPPPPDPMQAEAELLAELGMPHAIRMRHATPHFAHVFSGDGYSSGYYSYMWSEVMDADAFEAFRETGDPFDPDTAARLERHILAAGGSAEPEALYRAFRGRMPGVDALLRGRGLAA